MLVIKPIDDGFNQSLTVTFTKVSVSTLLAVKYVLITHIFHTALNTDN